MGICCCLLDPQTNTYQAEVCFFNDTIRPDARVAPAMRWDEWSRLPTSCEEQDSPQ